MRTNMPVTNREYVIDSSTTIVSKTDLHGNITYINQEFIQVSGFSESELIGAPQNIIRHPDMPEEAFEDLWRTLKNGKCWTGLVKNRCKNGDHYWVEATASPVMENGTVTGYTSIRVAPDRNQINAAETAYRSLKDGNKNITIHEGNARSASLFYADEFFAAISLKTKLTTFTLLSTLLFAATAAAIEFGGSSATPIAVGLASVGVLCTIIFFMIISRSIIRPLEQAALDIEAMSEGDLSGRISSNSNDEIGILTQSLRILQTNIKLLIGQIHESTLQVTNGANEIANGSFDLSERTESQASSLEQTAASMEQLTSTVKQNAENAKEANQLVLDTSQTAAHGGEDVNQVINTMASIKKSSGKISEIIGVIDGIAFQTNILALNAAVEAARAGEQGRGFAVVASEVRTLAQRSASAAKEIKILINDSVDAVDAGGTLVDDAGTTMSDIVRQIKRVSDLMADITYAGQEQSAGIEQVNQAIIQMDAMTQQNAAMVEQATAASQSLKNQAEALVNLVNTFRLVRSTDGRGNSNRQTAENRLHIVSSSEYELNDESDKNNDTLQRRYG